jgi:GT2 family glycosyltransferase
MAVGYGSKNDAELLKNQGVLCIANASEDMMPLYYSACDIYTTCSKWEGFDLPVGESQYFGKPVICYNIGAHPEVLIDGKTGFIVSNADEFAQKIKYLAENHIERLDIGENAREFVKKFYWQNSIDSYEKEIDKILKSLPPKKVARESRKAAEPFPCEKIQETQARQGEQPSSMNQEENRVLEEIESSLHKKVTVLIVNYNSSIPCMQECLDSLANQSYKNMEVVIFDNNSTNNTLDIIGANNSGVRIIRSEKNLGLGEAINQSLKYIDSPYLLISNFDTTYDKIAIEELADSIENLPGNYVGLAPKIKLYYQREYIESVGVYIDNNFYLGYNGMGQLDLDQYNRQEDVFGLSFTSAFIKRDYLCQSVTGTIDKPIDPTFFLFYEDMDFCYRANLMGYRFKSCPTAVCYHKYAYSFRDEATAFTTKYYYQKLNAMKLAYKNAEAGNMKRVIKNELSIQKQNLKDKNLKGVAKKIFADWRMSQRYLKRQRPYIQITRQVPDGEIIKFSWGEKNYFDIVNNEPVYCIENLLLTYKRLFVITGNRKYEEYIQYLEALNDTRFKIEIPLMKNFLHSKLEYEPLSIHHFIDRIR